MLTLKCPGDGIHWTERHAVVGHHARGDIAVDDLLTLDDVSTEAPKTKVLPKARM